MPLQVVSDLGQMAFVPLSQNEKWPIRAALMLLQDPIATSLGSVGRFLFGQISSLTAFQRLAGCVYAPFSLGYFGVQFLTLLALGGRLSIE